jgi:REP element-mobilizing transposase RayT
VALDFAAITRVPRGTHVAMSLRMTPARQILPGRTYLVTRRCSERRFFLTPSKSTNQLLLFALAVYADRYGILIHAFCFLSNHVHLVLTDPNARLPDFLRDLNSAIARALNAKIGHWDSFWDNRSTSVVPLESPEDVFSKIVYTLANPVAAGLVRYAREWPGLWSDPSQIGGVPYLVARPEGFFRENGPAPATARLQLRAPPGVQDIDTFVRAVRESLEREEDRLASELGRAGRSFLGARLVLAVNPKARPESREPRRVPNPTAAGADPRVRIAAILGLLEFRCAYQEALAAWRAGLRDVLFPPGTWAMRVYHGARCAAPT